jgi:UDP-GlcNAc3NAcA epimerase
VKIITVIGARPQFIKAAVVSHAFAQKSGVQEILLHTGQHFDNNMSNVFFEELGIPKPAYNLGIGGGLHGAMTGAQLAGIEKILIQEKPDWVMVYGDTNSTLAGALAAVKLHIPVAHVEAGLRSFNRSMPEEINRVVTDHISTTLYAPTIAAMQHLAQEGISLGQCHLVGDVMYDAALFFGERAQQFSCIQQKMGVSSKNYILVTIHRAENTDNLQRLQVILSALELIAQTIPVVWPIHPRTNSKLREQPQMRSLLGNNVHVIDPVGYLDMVMLEKNAAVIVTDSGGVQKEAFFSGVPCVTLRDETEWVELVEAGWNILVSPTQIEQVSEKVLNSIGSKGQPIDPYGDGSAAMRIATKF